MVQDIVGAFESLLNRDSLTIQVPGVFARLAGRDAAFEMVSSSTLQPLNLFYSHNRVSESVALIVVNSTLGDVTLDNADDLEEQARQLFEEELLFGEVRVCHDLTKAALVR